MRGGAFVEVFEELARIDCAVVFAGFLAVRESREEVRNMSGKWSGFYSPLSDTQLSDEDLSQSLCVESSKHH